MPAPIDHGFPVQRPGAILSADWIGPDDDLSLEVAVLDALGQQRVVSFPCRVPGQPGVMCLPSSVGAPDLSDDAIVAHVRMATWISRTIVGSKEWTAAFVDQPTANFQTAAGTCKVVASRMIDDALFEFDFRKGSGPIRTVLTDHSTMCKYRLEPEEQARVIPGAVKLEFPNYVHDYPGTVLSQAQKDAIRSYVLALALWM